MAQLSGGMRVAPTGGRRWWRERVRAPMAGELLRGRVMATLLDRSARAKMVVLEHQQLGRWAPSVR